MEYQFGNFLKVILEADLDMIPEIEPKPRRREILGNLWDWEGISKASGQIGEFAFSFFGTNPNHPENYLQIVEFLMNVREKNWGRLVVPNGPVLWVVNGVGFAAENDQGRLVDENFRVIERVNNIPSLCLSVDTGYRRWITDQNPNFSRIIGEFRHLLPRRFKDICPAWRVDFPSRGPIFCQFNFEHSFLIGQGQVPIKLRSLKSLVKQRMEKARLRRLI